MIIAFLGPPGSGKGTQADRLAEDHGFVHFDTGARLREEVGRGGELGERIASYINAGNLVPLEVIKDLVLKFIGEYGDGRIMFDGLPRSLEQAQVLDEGLSETGRSLDHALYLDIEEEELVGRIVNRRTCPACGEIYNLITNPPKQDGKCDVEGAELVQRADDNEATLRQRLSVYLDRTVPVLDYYREQGKLRMIDADQPIEQVTASILKVLGLAHEQA